MRPDTRFVPEKVLRCRSDAGGADDRRAGERDQHRAIGDRGFDPAVPIYDIASMERRMRTEEAPMAFAAVAGRTREIGIRTALGADPRRLIAGVMSDGLKVSAVAITAGVILAWALARSFSSALFGVAGNTTVTLAAAAVILVVMAAAASAIPARRAARVDPVTASRID